MLSEQLLPNSCFKYGTILKRNCNLTWTIYKQNKHKMCRNSEKLALAPRWFDITGNVDLLLLAIGLAWAEYCLQLSCACTWIANEEPPSFAFPQGYHIDFIMHQRFQNISGFLRILIFNSLFEPLAGRWHMKNYSNFIAFFFMKMNEKK